MLGDAFLGWLATVQLMHTVDSKRSHVCRIPASPLDKGWKEHTHIVFI